MAANGGSTERHELEELKARIALSEIIGRRLKLSGGRDKFACCPFHQERTASFSVNDRKQFFFCFGCRARGDVFDWLVRAEGLSFTEAVERVRREAGAQPVRRAQAEVPDADAARRQAAARAIWRAAQPIAGTVAERYLREARAISIALPDCLRFHPALPFDPNSDDTLPAMVAAVTDLAGELVGLQRTFLKPDGSGKADIASPKRSLGPIGRGAVHLGPAAATLGLAEGIETALSAAEIYRVPVWATLGCANLARAQLPPGVGNVVVFADRGAAGENAAEEARVAFHAQRRRVAVRFPHSGTDFNDQLKARRRGE